MPHTYQSTIALSTALCYVSTMTLGKQLRIARNARGFTQQALANRAGLSLPTIWGLEADRTKPDLATVLKVVAELGATLEFNEGGRLVTVKSSGLQNEKAKRLGNE